jgi:hypothetical protein
MLRVVPPLFRPTPRGSSASQYMRVESRSLLIILFPVHDPHALSTVIGGKNLNVPSQRMPAGIYVSINVDSQKRWKSAIAVLSSDESVIWGNTVTL